MNIREGLCTGIDVDEILAQRVTLVTIQVGKELLKITTEASLLAVGNEAVDGGSTIGSAIEFPGNAIDCRGSNGASGGGNRASTAKSSKPNHDFILIRATGGGRGEDVVRNVSYDARARVRPLPGGRHRRHGAKLLLACDLNRGITLDLGGTSTVVSDIHLHQGAIKEYNTLQTTTMWCPIRSCFLKSYLQTSTENLCQHPRSRDPEAISKSVERPSCERVANLVKRV